jgi:hypothetical protein
LEVVVLYLLEKRMAELNVTDTKKEKGSIKKAETTTSILLRWRSLLRAHLPHFIANENDMDEVDTEILSLRRWEMALQHRFLFGLLCTTVVK